MDIESYKIDYSEWSNEGNLHTILRAQRLVRLLQKNLDAKLEIKTGKFGNAEATGKNKFCSELKELKTRKGNGLFEV